MNKNWLLVTFSSVLLAILFWVSFPEPQVAYPAPILEPTPTRPASPPIPTEENPTVIPTNAPGNSFLTVPDGAFIQLQVEFSSIGSNQLDQRCMLWTVIQWQDKSGNWHNVAGWQGLLDSITPYGYKEWWLPEKLFGAGPFRWGIYQAQDGKILAQSETFHLPEHNGQVVTVPVQLPSY